MTTPAPPACERRWLAGACLTDDLPPQPVNEPHECRQPAGHPPPCRCYWCGTREETTMTESAPAAPDHDAEVDRELIDRFGYALIERFGEGPQREVLVTAAPDPAHRRCPNCGSETSDDIGTLLAELRQLRHQYSKIAGELADATMTMWHLEPDDRSDMPLAERITTLVAELTRQRAPHHSENGLEAT